MYIFLIFGSPFLIYEIFLFIKPNTKLNSFLETKRIAKFMEKDKRKKIKLSALPLFIYFMKYPYIIWLFTGIFIMPFPLSYLMILVLFLVSFGDEMGYRFLNFIDFEDWVFIPYFRLLSLISVLILGYPYYLAFTTSTFLI